MYPVLVTALTRLAGTARWGKFVTALSSAAGVTLKSLNEVKSWAASNKGAAALIASSLVEAGISIAEFFRDSDGKPMPDAMSAAVKMSEFAKVSPKTVMMLMEALSHDGDVIKLDLEGEAETNEQIARVTLAYVKDNILNSNSGDLVAQMLELHSALQLFAALSHNDVSRLMRDEISPVGSYVPRVMRPFLLAGA